MSELIACLSNTESTKNHVLKLITCGLWDKIFLITDNEHILELNLKNLDFVVINMDLLLPDLIESLKKKLKDRVIGPEIGLNLISGSGKMHMAVLSALLKLGFGIRLVAFTKDGVREV